MKYHPVAYFKPQASHKATKRGKVKTIAGVTSQFYHRSFIIAFDNGTHCCAGKAFNLLPPTGKKVHLGFFAL